MTNFNKRIFTVAFLITSLFSSKMAHSQVEPHFSQYYMYPMWLNPALTGAIDGDFRVSAIHRTQWSSIANGFSTTAVSADMVTNKNVNLGVNIMQQSAGDAGYKYTNAQFSLCYTGIRFGREGDKVVTFALQGGLLNRRFDIAKSQVDDQYNGTTYDPNRATNEFTGKTSAASLDLGAGALFYDADPDKKINIFAGVAAAHITKPKDPSLSAGNNDRLPVRYTVHGGANIYLTENAHLVPNALFMTQGNVNEMMLGTYVQMSVNPFTDIMAGINYRVKDAFYPYVGLSYNNFTVGCSYDVNSSQLGKMVNGASSFEISLLYENSKKEKGYFKCPRF